MELCFVSQPQFIHTNNTGIVGELVRIANLALPTNLILLEHVRSAYATEALPKNATAYNLKI